MKALIRESNEIILESDGIVGIDWSTGAPLTNPSWAGGPYVLVENYDPTMCETRSSESEGAVTESPSTVSYGGKEYTLEELKKLIG